MNQELETHWPECFQWKFTPDPSPAPKLDDSVAPSASLNRSFFEWTGARARARNFFALCPGGKEVKEETKGCQRVCNEGSRKILARMFPVAHYKNHPGGQKWGA